MIRSLLVTLFLLSPLAAQASFRSTAPPLAQVTAVSHGLQLTLSIPRHSYPRYALVRVQGIVKNVSGHTIWFRGNNNSPPGISNPEPDVLSASGKVVYPPAFPYDYPLPGPFVPPQPLAPGQSIGGEYIVILRDAWIRLALQYTTTNPRQGIGPFGTARTSALHLYLTPAQRPTLTTHPPPERLSAVVRPPLGGPADARGKLLSVEYSDCPDTTDNWMRIVWSLGGTTLEPDCEMPQQWHVVAGWLGYSVVRVDYSAPPAHR